MTAPYISSFEPEWRTKALKSRLAFAYTNKLFTDVTIGVWLGGKEHVFKAHKSILAYFSSTFRQRFYGNKQQDLSCLKLKGIDPQGLDYILKLLYHVPPSPRKDIDRSILVSAYHAAKMVGMIHIEAQLRREILDHILTYSLVQKDDFWKILELSRILKLVEITDKLLRFTESHTKDVLNAKSLTRASPATLRAVLDLDNLKGSEKDVLRSIARWKQENLNIPFVQEFVWDLLECVRFRNLSSMDLCQFVATDADLMNGEDVLAIMMHLGDPSSRPLPPWCSTKFRCPAKSLPKGTLTQQEETSTNIPNNNKELLFKITTRGHPGLLNLYFEKKYTDVCFLVGSDRKQVKAHRSILAIGSVVFERMFFSSVPDNSERIDIPNEDPESFDKMLMYFYDDSNTDGLFRKFGVAAKIFNVALKYGSANLKNLCLKYYSPGNKLSTSFWQKLEQLIHPPSKNEKPLKQLMDYAANNTRDVLECSAFLNATLDAVKHLLQLDTLSVREIEVLKNVVRWLEQNSKFSKSEKSRFDLLSLIRFSNITAEEFSDFTASHSNLLPQEQLVSIILHLHNRTLPLPDWCYKGPPRKLTNLSFPYNVLSYQQEGDSKYLPEKKLNIIKMN